MRLFRHFTGALFAASLLALAAGTAAAREAPSRTNDPVLEARVMRIAEELRCLVCQNETLAASQADLAVDLRRQIEAQLVQGRSEAQILDFMVQRYGDFVLYRPPLKASTALLWVGPFVLLAVAFGALAWQIRRRRGAIAERALSPEQTERARQLLDEPAPPAL